MARTNPTFCGFVMLAAVWVVFAGWASEPQPKLPPMTKHRSTFVLNGAVDSLAQKTEATLSGRDSIKVAVLDFVDLKR